MPEMVAVIKVSCIPEAVISPVRVMDRIRSLRYSKNPGPGDQREASVPPERLSR